MFDACYELLTAQADGGELEGGQAVRGVEVQVITPFSVLNGQDHELAEIPGFGPILPATARDLAAHADRLRRVCVDDDGNVTAVDDATPGPARTAEPTPTAERAVPTTPATVVPVPEEAVPADTSAAAPEARSQRPSAARTRTAPDPADFLRAALLKMANDPVLLRNLTSRGYRIPGRISRFVKARDRTCVFPGCHRSARYADDDHREPWPAGKTDTANLQCLCRHHHRAKQACYQVRKLPDGSYRWTTRTGHSYTRPPQGF